MEKESVENELRELKEQLEHVEAWKQRRNEIDVELGKVWTVNGSEGVDNTEEVAEEPAVELRQSQEQIAT